MSASIEELVNQLAGTVHTLTDQVGILTGAVSKSVDQYGEYMKDTNKEIEDLERRLGRSESIILGLQAKLKNVGGPYA